MIRTIHEQTGRSVRRIAQTLGVPRSSHYHAHAAVPTPMAQPMRNSAGV